MKRILLVMKYPLSEPYTLKQKFDGQIEALRNMGLDTWYLSFDKEYVYVNHDNCQEKIKKTLFGNNAHYFHTFAFVDIFLSVIKLLEKEEFNYVYFRKSPIGIIGYTMCKRIRKRNTKLVVEIPTYPEKSERGKNFLRRTFSKYSAVWWKKCNRYVSLFTLIGEDSDNYTGYPAINIQNGVSVNNIPLRKPVDDGKIHLLALASMCKWQGYDRIIQSLADYEGVDKENIIIDMVGGDGDGSLKSWELLAKKLGISSQVVFHGWKEGDELTKLFNLATLGVCGLGLYRKGLEKGSILKLREFTARGLPFIYAAEDSNIDAELGYSYKVSNNDDPIDMSGIIEFAKRVKNRMDLYIKMRDYARNNITWDRQFEKILNRL